MTPEEFDARAQEVRAMALDPAVANETFFAAIDALEDEASNADQRQTVMAIRMTAEAREP